jgi:LPXTG-motif cell wall-anchored protein
MKRILVLATLTLGVFALTPMTAHANQGHKPDPCPGEHVQVYNDAHGNNYPEVGGHFVCGPISGPAGTPGENGTDGANCYDYAIQSEGLPNGNVEPIQGGGVAEGNDAGGTPNADPRSLVEQYCVGAAGAPGVQGEPGAAGVGVAGPAGSSGDTAQLHALITELNNRLFILENTDVDYSWVTCALFGDWSFAPPTQLAHLDGDNDGTACEAESTEVLGEQIDQPAAPTGELPHTGSNTTWTLLFLGAALFATGSVLRYAFKR